MPSFIMITWDYFQVSLGGHIFHGHQKGKFISFPTTNHRQITREARGTLTPTSASVNTSERWLLYGLAMLGSGPFRTILNRGYLKKDNFEKDKDENADSGKDTSGIGQFWTGKIWKLKFWKGNKNGQLRKGNIWKMTILIRRTLKRDNSEKGKVWKWWYR